MVAPVPFWTFWYSPPTYTVSPIWAKPMTSEFRSGNWSVGSTLSVTPQFRASGLDFRNLRTVLSGVPVAGIAGWAASEILGRSQTWVNGTVRVPL